MEELEYNKTQNNILSVICIVCKNKNRHKVLLSVEKTGREPMGYQEYYFWSSIYQIIECQGCGAISFRSEDSNSEDYDEDGVHFQNVLIYPKRTSDTWEIKSFFNVPNNLRRIYRETIDCYNNDNLILCGAGIRGLVEGLCKENNIIDGEIEIKKNDGSIIKRRIDNLQGKINGLYENGKLTKDNAEILHEHRFLGNKAIHELQPPSKEELDLALEIIENIFNTLYEIPQKGMQLKHQRLNNKK
ncbi:DUF4145 domain-containing protein [Flavobacterium subsaxonicum]|uniref:DUF4145 domain-containing protein n=1 Tax=Flavobacterium subsaxonicum WB 4.1-42 = DSM 21790 TaxID=1121898 RepID=A0A0A2MPP6_9FLAO|nr:DUF4145 domain-containing protein [Flavobacterium subsaxonicum]KGO94294.1 hypothetical protein Q766_05075 [Flavobacterium subsaxonicum WB 4.1-42 = DSM 21790]